MRRTAGRAGPNRRGDLLRALVPSLAWAWVGWAHAADGGPAVGCAQGSEQEGFWQRLADSYQAHLFPRDTPPAEDSSAAPGGYDPQRVPPPPQTIPPWPYSTWNVGGTPAIGYENIYYGPLMDALWCGHDGASLKDSRLTIYGWIEPGGNISSSTSSFNKVTGTGGNYPAAYSYQPNHVQLDQFALYLERTPDMVQKEHFDWGFRLAGIYGTDYKYTFSNGVFSNQYTKEQHLYGADPVMYYLDLYFPAVADGMNVRVGRFISIPDIEAQLAPNNLTYSHSLLYTYDPYTQHGLMTTTRLNRNWSIQMGVTAGNDVWPFLAHEAHLSGVACVVWLSDSGNDQLYPCMNNFNDSHWRWNNMQHAVATWYHKFNARWHTDTEAYYMWQSHTPNASNPEGLAAIGAQYPAPQFAIGAPFGAQCDPQVPYCYSYSWGVVNYVNFQLTPHDIVVFRSDFLDDAKGQRTGFRTRYLEFDLGYTHWVGDALELRPELRFERALDVDAYDNPAGQPGHGKQNQLMLAADMIFHF